MAAKEDQKLTKAQRMEQARQQAAKIQKQQESKKKRKKILTIVGILVVIVVIIAVVAAFVFSAVRNSEPVSGPAPANVDANGGVLVTANNKVKSEQAGPDVTVSKDDSAQTKDGNPPGLKQSGKKAKIVVYLDFLCPMCSQFEQAYSNYLKDIRDKNLAEVEYRTVTILDDKTRDTYSARASSAAYCVVNKNPDKYIDFSTLLFANQPQETSTNMPKAKDLASLAGDMGLDQDIQDCISNETYKAYATYGTAQAREYKDFTGTPQVYVNGKLYKLGQNQPTLAEFAHSVDSKLPKDLPATTKDNGSGSSSSQSAQATQ